MNNLYHEISPGHAKPSRSFRQEINNTDKQMQNPLILRASHWNGRAPEIDRWTSASHSPHYDALPTVSFKGGRTFSDDNVVNCYNSLVPPSFQRTNQLHSVCQDSFEKQSLASFSPQLPCNFNGDLTEIKEQKGNLYLNSHEQWSASWQLQSKNPGNTLHCSSDQVGNNRTSLLTENRLVTNRQDPVAFNVGYPRFGERITAPYTGHDNSSGNEIDQGSLPAPVSSYFTYNSSDKQAHFTENPRVASVPSLISANVGRHQDLRSSGETRHSAHNSLNEPYYGRGQCSNAGYTSYPTAARFAPLSPVPRQPIAPGKTLPCSGSSPYSHSNVQAPFARANTPLGQRDYHYLAQSTHPITFSATFCQPSSDNVSYLGYGAQQYVTSNSPSLPAYTLAQRARTNEGYSILQTHPRATFSPQSACVPNSTHCLPGTLSPWQGYSLSQHSPCVRPSAASDPSTFVNGNLIYNPVTISGAQTLPGATRNTPLSNSSPQFCSNPNSCFVVQTTKSQPGISPMGQNLQGVGPENELPQSFLNSFNNLANFSSGDASGPTDNGTSTRREPGASDGAGPSLLEKTELLKEKIVSAFAQAADGSSQQASGSNQETPCENEGKERRTSANGRRLHRSNTYDGTTWSSMKGKHRTGSLYTDSAEKRSPMTNFGNHRTLSQRQHSVIVCTAVIPLPAPVSNTVTCVASSSTTHCQLAYALPNSETGIRHLAGTCAETGHPNVNHIGDLAAANNRSQQHCGVGRKQHGGLESFPIEDIAGGRLNLGSNPTVQNVSSYYHNMFPAEYTPLSATTLPQAAPVVPGTGYMSYACTGGLSGSLRKDCNATSLLSGTGQPLHAEAIMRNSGPANLLTRQPPGPSWPLDGQPGSRIQSALGTSGEARNWPASQPVATIFPPNTKYSYPGPQGPGIRSPHPPEHSLDFTRAHATSLQSCAVSNCIVQPTIVPSPSVATRSSGPYDVQRAHTPGTPCAHSITPDATRSHVSVMDGTSIICPPYPIDARNIYERSVAFRPPFPPSFPGSPERVGAATTGPACLVDSQGQSSNIFDHRVTLGQLEAMASSAGPPCPPPSELGSVAHQVQGHGPLQGVGSLGSNFPLSSPLHATDSFTCTKIRGADSQVAQRKVQVTADCSAGQALACQGSQQGGLRQEETEQCASHSQPVLLMSSSWPSSSFPVLVRDPRVKIPEVEAYNSVIPAILEQLQQRTDGSFSQLLSIAVKLQDMEEDILKFTGKHGDQEYVYLEEMLTRQLLALDQVLADGDEEIRTSRRSLVKEVQELLEILDRRAKA